MVRRLGQRGCAVGAEACSGQGAGEQLLRPLHSTHMDWVCSRVLPRALAQPCTYRQEHGQMCVDRRAQAHGLALAEFSIGVSLTALRIWRRGEETGGEGRDGSVLLTLNWPRSIGVNYGSCLA